jgi:molybdenum cofactor biosynthesis enzyme MoaA
MDEKEEELSELQHQLNRIEKSLKDLHSKVYEDLKQQNERYEKMMDGFRRIRDAFMMNCEKQQELFESIDDFKSYDLGIMDFR